VDERRWKNIMHVLDNAFTVSTQLTLLSPQNNVYFHHTDKVEIGMVDKNMDKNTSLVYTYFPEDSVALLFI
jgi:hypothetical protein